jgi:small subunit ribosomal protein S1
MNNENMELSMNDFLESIDNSLKKIQSGDVIKGKVLSIHDDGITVNIDYIYDGFIPYEEVSSEKNINIYEVANIGDNIDVMIIRKSDGEGHVLLSKKRADAFMAWKELNNNYSQAIPFPVKASEIVKGGAVANYKGIRMFIPVSQLSIDYVKNIGEYIGKELQVKIIEFDEEKNKVVISARVIEAEIKKNNEITFFKNLKVGDIREGVVTKIVKYGAFVDIDGIEGLIHLNELSWKHIVKPEDVVAPGDKVEVYILSIDEQNKKVGLSLKNTVKNPWDTLDNKFAVGAIVDGTVIKMARFGAFVEIDDGIEGLVHLNEITEENIIKPEDKLKIGDKVKVKILDLQHNNKRISLSIKDAVDSNKEYEKYNDNSELSISDLISEKLKNFKFE